MINVKKARIILISLLVLWMSVIFIMSAQPAEESSQLSGGIVSSLIAAICRNFDTLSAQQQLEITNIVTFIVRKTAHFSEYFVLGVLVSLIATTFNKLNYKLRFGLSIAFCVLYAASDELHQYFVPGRACRLTDICIDATGGAIAVLLVTIIVYKLRQRLCKKCVKAS